MFDTIYYTEQMFDTRKRGEGMEDSRKMGESMPVNIPVQMYCVVDTTGRISPFKFKLETAEHVIETVKVQEIVSRDEKRYVGIREMQFICKVSIGEMTKLLELRLNIDSQKWRIFQFL